MVTIKYDKNELVHFRNLLESACDDLANKCCNDFPVPNTDENWALYQRVMKWGNGEFGEDHERPPHDKAIYFYDRMLLGYLADRLKTKGD